MVTSMMVNKTLGYSQAVRAGNLLFVSGQVAVDDSGQTIGIGDVRAQARQAMANLRGVLDSAGTSLRSVAMLTTYATSLGMLMAIREVRHEVFGPIGYYPASTFVVITSLAKPEYLVEIEAVAVIAATGRGDSGRAGRARPADRKARVAARTARRQPSSPRRRTTRRR
jgi:enamine deaminase RidA (YjgF/YER057c/UK114 family)